jgi:hypothetical protein
LLTPTAIPPYTYGSAPPVPAQPCPTIGAPLLLIAQDDTDPEAVARLLETIYDSPLTNVIRPRPLRDQVAVFPLHPGTQRYLRRNDPLLKPEHASRLATLAGGMGAFLSGSLAFYGFLRLRKLRRFESFYHKIGHIDLLAHGLQVDPTAPTDPEALRSHLEAQLTALKHEALKEFEEGGLKGEGLMAGIIALINDTRQSLAGMVPARSSERS